MQVNVGEGGGMSTDQKHLEWIYDRLIHVHNESPNVDYMLRFRGIIDGGGAAPPAPETPAEALAARPLFEQVARLGDDAGIGTVARIMAISSRARAWLEGNPPGQPVAIEPRGCPTPGACSCVEPATPPAPLIDLAARLISESRPIDPEIAEALTPEARWDLYEGPATPAAPEVAGIGGVVGGGIRGISPDMRI